MAKGTIVFVHGLWMHSSSWQPWMDFFSAKGYDCIAPPWPGDSETVAECRSNPKPIANRGITEIADSYAKVIAGLSQPPILIGHSFGGLLVQNLLGRGLASAAVAIDPAPIKGVWQLPLSALKASFPVLGNPFNLTKAVSLTFKQFQYGFANAIPEEEGRELFDKYAIPGPGRPLFQAAFATLNPWSETKVNSSNTSRGPLLLIAGERDHIAPTIFTKATYKIYKKSTAITELKSFEGRGHSLILDHGWKEIAEYAAGWLEGKGV